ncbi:MAG: acetyltransferase [Magnetococcales bacterium]|nr:acetyltransferase [Magnetococcales bacterium]
MKDNLSVLVLGGGGHAAVVVDALLRQRPDVQIIGLLDERPEQARQRTWPTEVLGGDEHLTRFDPQQIWLINGIGSIGMAAPRRQMFEQGKRLGYRFLTVIHPAATLADQVHLGEGVQIMAGAILQTGCFIDDNSIINTRASIDHDCHIGAHSHIAPGVTLCGHVSVGHESHIGAGAVIVQGLRIGARSIVGAGAAVLHHVADSHRVVGVPAREMQG